MKYPKITIITITFNSENTVRDTFESVRNQKYSNLEYLIIDGGSNDSTLKIAEEYSDVITTVISEPDNGISDAMNKGIRLASGDLIGIIHSDDLLANNALDLLAREWDGDSDVYYGHSVMIDAEGKPLHILRAKDNLQGMEYAFQMVHASTFVTKKAYLKFGIFDTKYKCAMDYDLLLRMYKNGAVFHYIDEVLSMYRIGGTNMKLRRKTINEVREISIYHGGKRTIANAIRLKKLIIERIRPLITKLHLQNSRVQKI